MCPTGVPESFQRRRSHAGSNEGVGDLLTFSTTMSTTETTTKSAPSSPKIEANRFANLMKSQQDSGLPFTSLAERAWASLSREHLAANDEVSEVVSLTDKNAADRQSLFRDLCQTQLALWTFAVSTLLTYFLAETGSRPKRPIRRMRLVGHHLRVRHFGHRRHGRARV